MKRFKSFLISPAFIATFISIIVMSITLLFEPIIGLSDNGDFSKVINGQGIYKLDRYEKDQYYDYFSSKYGIYEYFNEYESNSPSTQILFIKAGKFLNNIFSANKLLFDIRYLSIILILYCAFSIYLLVDYASYNRSKLAGYLIGLFCIFIFADTGYIAYFNSFYAESVLFISALASMASALLLTQNRYPPCFLMVLVVANGLIAMGAKQQSAPIGILLALLCFFFARKDSIKNKPSIKKAFRTFSVLSGIFLCITNLAFYIFVPNDFLNTNKYPSMTRGAMKSSKNPEETLKFFNINSQYSILNDTAYYDKYPSVDVNSQILQDNFYSKYSFASIFTYYLFHPQNFFYMLGKAGENAYILRPQLLGNYERIEGFEAGKTTEFFSLYSTLKNKVVPKTVGFFVIWIILVILFTFKNKTKMVVFICIMLIGLSQIGVSIITIGDANLSKNLFLFNVSFDLIIFTGFSTIISRISQKISGKYTLIKEQDKSKKIINV